MVDPELVEVLTSFTDNITENMNSFKDKIIEDMNSFKSEIKEDMNSFKNEIKEDIHSLDERLTSLERTCTVIEKEHGEKLDLLLDYASANIEKHEEYDKKHDEIDRKLFIHDAKLAIIEGSDFYKKNIKGTGKSNLKNAIL